MLQKIKNYFSEIGWKRFVYMVLAIVFLGIGVTLLRLAGFGTDPFSCMVFGLIQHLPIRYGTLQILINIVLFIPVIILYPRSFGVGAFVNMFGLGYIVDLCLYLCGLGIAPYDMIAQLIEDKTHRKIPFKAGRIMTDMICISIGIITGGTMGLATIVVGFFTGPLVSAFRQMVKKKLLSK